MKFIFETGKEVICNDETIAKILRQDKRYKEITADKEVVEKGTKAKKKTADKEVVEKGTKAKKKTADKEVEEVGEKDAEVQE